jgi:hypothetical protein
VYLKLRRLPSVSQANVEKKSDGYSQEHRGGERQDSVSTSSLTLHSHSHNSQAAAPRAGSSHEAWNVTAQTQIPPTAEELSQLHWNGGAAAESKECLWLQWMERETCLDSPTLGGSSPMISPGSEVHKMLSSNGTVETREIAMPPPKNKNRRPKLSLSSFTRSNSHSPQDTQSTITRSLHSPSTSPMSSMQSASFTSPISRSSPSRISPRVKDPERAIVKIARAFEICGY